MSNTLETKRSQFTRYLLNLTHDACSSLFALRRDYPLDEEAIDRISYYADLLFLRGMGYPAEEGIDEEGARILARWSEMNLSRVCEEFVTILNHIVEGKIASKAKQNFFVCPDFSNKRKEIEEEIISMASNQFEIYRQNKENLALNA